MRYDKAREERLILEILEEMMYGPGAIKAMPYDEKTRKAMGGLDNRLRRETGSGFDTIKGLPFSEKADLLFAHREANRKYGKKYIASKFKSLPLADKLAILEGKPITSYFPKYRKPKPTKKKSRCKPSKTEAQKEIDKKLRAGPKFIPRTKGRVHWYRGPK